MQGFRPITWMRESPSGGHYFIDVRCDGTAHAAYMERGAHETVGEGHSDLGSAILACAMHEHAKQTAEVA